MSINTSPQALLTYRKVQSRVHSFPSAIFQQNIAEKVNSLSEVPQFPSVGLKAEPYINRNHRLNNGEREGGYHRNALSFSNNKGHSIQRTVKEISSNKDITTPTPISKSCIPIPLCNHHSKNNFHNTFNRKFYNTKYVYNALNSNLFQSKGRHSNELFQSSSVNLVNQFNPLKFEAKKDLITEKNATELNKTLKNAFRNQIHHHHHQHASIDCTINSNTTTTQETPIIRKTIQKHYHYMIEKQFAQSKAGRDYNGATKINQDSYVMKELKINGTLVNLIGVFDGHGLNGHKISRNIKAFFSNLDFSGNSFSSSSVSSQTSQWTPPEQLKCLNHSQLFSDKSYSFIHKLFDSLSNYIFLIKGVDAKLSGSTCILLFHSNNKLICANCGDSRAILIQENGSIIQLSRDHKPNLPVEKHRIESKGGRVEQAASYYGEGPYRVWFKNENYPGLAMSRSIGDLIAHSIGVSSEPEITEFDLNEIQPKIMVTASDGVWDVLSNDKVAYILLPFYSKGDYEGASKKLVEEALKMWEDESMGVVDDITVIISFF